MIQFKKLSEEWEASNEYGHKVNLSVSYGPRRQSVDITPPDGGGFKFLTSDPTKAEMISELIKAADSHGKKILLDAETAQG